MGCSASVQSKGTPANAPSAGVKVVKDEEDYTLFPIILDPTSIPEFDTVFEQLEAILAQFITWSNAISDYAVAVQNLLAPGLGSIVPDIQVAKNVDMLSLDLITPFNKQRAAPQHHVLLEWVKNKDVRDADEALAQARMALMQFIAHSSMQVHLKLMEAPPGHVALNILQADVPEADQERVLAVNAGVEQLQKAVGKNFGVLLKLIPGAAKLRGKTGLALLCKRQARDTPDDAPGNLVPATMVDIFNCGMTEAILKADRSVVIVANELAKLSQQYDPPLAMQDEPKGVRKLRSLPVAREYEEVNRAIRNLNAVLFKLGKACAKSAWIHSTPLSMPEVDFPDLPFMVCEALKRVAETTWSICKKQLDSIHLVALLTHHEPFTITPIFVHSATTFHFTMEVTVDQSLLIDKAFPDFLPPQIRAVWDALLALQAVVQEAVNVLEPLRPEYERLHEQAREFATMAAEASSKHQLSMAEASRATKITMANLQQVFDAKALVFKVYEDNVSRIVMAYSKAAREIKQDLQKKLAELSSQLPRGLAKPAFSPELLEIAKQSISPAELAATMTLALAASSLDPVMLATKQQQIALTGSAAAALAAPASPGTPDLNHLTSAWASLAAQNQHSSSNFMGSGRTAADIFADYSNPSGAPNASAMQQPSMFWPSLAGSLSAPNDPAAISNLWSQYAGYGSFAATANDPSGFSFSPSGGSNQNPWQVAAASMQQGSYVPSRLGGPTAASAMMAPPTSYTHSVQPGAMAAPWPDMSAWGSMIPSAPATDAPGGMAVPAAVPPMQPVQQQ